MWPVEYLLAPLILGGFYFGHLALWVIVINRLHATGLPRPVIKGIDKLIYLLVLGVPAAVIYLDVVPGFTIPSVAPVFLGYVFVCLTVAVLVSIVWVYRRTRSRRPECLVSNDTIVMNATEQLDCPPVHGWRARFAATVPFNQIFQINVNVKTLVVPSLPPALDGLSIAHLSDIHMTGRLTRPFFDYIVDRANELDADLVCITGDIVEKVHCLPWIEPTLGRLKVRHGKFFVLGNHDKRIRDVAAVRHALTDAGLVDLGGRFVIHNVHDMDILLAGNELPWFGPLPDLSSAPAAGSGKPFRVLLSHTPDQIGWAQYHKFDLMLAGHNHGGQICLPFIGPLVSPSYYGVKYAYGLFQEGSTLLHVSRGVSSLEPFRFNCPPELTKLVLVRERPAIKGA